MTLVAQKEDVTTQRDRRERFVGLAEARVNKALKSIRLVGNLSNRSNYDYTDEDVRQIVRAIEETVGDMKQRFKDAERRDGATFRLKSKS